MGISSIRTVHAFSEISARRFGWISTVFLEVGIILFVLVSYDINTTTLEGKRRLRKVAKECLNYGQRVQNSVFECKVDEGQLIVLKNKLYCIIDKGKDNLRFYRLGKNYKSTVESFGIDISYDIEGPLIL